MAENEQTTSTESAANPTLAANAAAVDTSASTGAAQSTQTNTAAASSPCALEAGGKEHQRLSKSLKTKDRAKAYERMEKIAAKNNGNYTFIDNKTGEKLTMPMAEAKNYIETNNANGIPMYVNGAGTWGGHFLFQATGKPKEEPQQPVVQVDNTAVPATQDNGGFWNWCKRNWYWLLAGAGALAVGIVFLCRKKKKSNTYIAPDDPDKKPVDPGDKNPGGDKPGNDGNTPPSIDDGDLNNGNGGGSNDGPSGGNGGDGGNGGGNGGDGGNGGGNGGDGGGNGGDGGNGGSGGDGGNGGSGGNGDSTTGGGLYDWGGDVPNGDHSGLGDTLQGNSQAGTDAPSDDNPANRDTFFSR